MIPRPAARAHARRPAAVLLAVVALVTLAGCIPLDPSPSPSRSASPTGSATPVTVAPEYPLVVPAVLAYCPLESAVHFDGYWLPVDEVYICRADGHHSTDGVSSYGPWETAYRIPQPQALLRAYRKPDAEVGNPLLCDHVPQDPLIIWVHHDGVTSAYYAPVDGCGNPNSEARDAYDAARRVTLIAVDRGAPDGSKKDRQG